MLKKLFNFLFTNNNTKITKPIKKRKLQFETLESRELLSVSFAEFDAIRSQYADLELSANMNDYNVIEITAAQLSDANLRNAITTAGTTTKNDLIVIRNNKNAIVDLKDKSLEINIDTTIFGSIGIVSLGQNKLQLQSNSSSGVISVLQGDLILGGVVLTGTENSQQESLDTSALLQTGINADVQTSQVIKITENSNRAGNFTIFTDANTSTKLQSTSGGSPIGSKSYSITVDVDGASGSLEAYLTGLTETEKNSIIAGSTSFLSTLNPFDAEKNGNGDRDHCWAGTSSNMLAYTGWGNVNGFQTEDDIFDYFRTNFTDAGGRSFYGNEWFITGSYGAPTDDGWAQLQSINTGCFYPDINIKNFAADSCSMKSAIAITSAVDKLKDNAAIGLSIGWFSSSHDRTGGHAITMWGVIYDTSKSSTNNDYYVSLLVSDSDDNKNNGANAKNVLKSLNIAYDTTYSSYKFTNYSSGGYLEDYTWLSQYSDNPVDTIPTPTNFRTTAQTSSYITLQWDAVTDAQYFLRRRALNQSTWTTRTSSTTSGNFACDADTTYEWQLCAVKDGKYSNWTTIFASTTITSLATPANFNSTTQTEDSVTLSWNIVNNAISYEIQYKKTTQTEWTTWTNSLKPSATSTTITNLESGTSYQFQIRSINGNTLSSWQPANATTKIPPIIAPANFISVSQTHDSVTLNWNIQSNLSSYKLEYKKSSTSTWQTWTAPDISATSATITGLDALTQYDFRLTATNANGSRNSITTATTKVLLPTPQNLRAASSGKTAVALDWSDVENATEYVLQQKNEIGTFVEIYRGSESKFVDTNLTAGTEYSYRVQAVGSAFSEEVNVTTLATDVSDVPVIITSEVDVDDKVKLEWSDLGLEYYYYVFRNGSLLSNDQQSTNYVDNKSLTGIHEYYVYAYNENTGKWSNALPVVMIADTIKSTVDAEIFSHEISPDGKIELNWSPINNAQQIIIFRNGIPVSTILGSQDTTWTDQSPSNNKNNEYVIYVGYLDDFNRTNWTWSSPYVVKKATTTSPPTAALPAPNSDIFNEFWANYDL